MFIVSAVYGNFVLDLEACQKRIVPPLADCKGMYKLNSFIMALGKNQKDRTHVRKSCLHTYSCFS